MEFVKIGSFSPAEHRHNNYLDMHKYVKTHQLKRSESMLKNVPTMNYYWGIEKHACTFFLHKERTGE